MVAREWGMGITEERKRRITKKSKENFENNGNVNFLDGCIAIYTYPHLSNYKLQTEICIINLR